MFLKLIYRMRYDSPVDRVTYSLLYNVIGISDVEFGCYNLLVKSDYF